MNTSAPRPAASRPASPVFRSCRRITAGADEQCGRSEIATRETRRPVGHVMIGLVQQAADQPGATPEVRALAQRLRTRHRATNIGE